MNSSISDTFPRAALIAGIFADEGISGTAKHEEFQRLMNNCRKGKIDRILTKSVSRFARNTVDNLNYKSDLKALNIAGYFETEIERDLTQRAGQAEQSETASVSEFEDESEKVEEEIEEQESAEVSDDFEDVSAEENEDEELDEDEGMSMGM